MKFQVDPAFRGRAAVEYIEEVLDLFDTTELAVFKIRQSKARGGTYKGSHGRCSYPDPFAPPNSIKRLYRISCSIGGTDADFPHKAGRHAGVIRSENVAENLDEMIVDICGHELYHFLGFEDHWFWPVGTRQIPGDNRDERGADLTAYEFLYAFREGRSPVELAAALIGEEPRVAHNRYPYK